MIASKQLRITLLILVVAIVAFVFLDFHFAKSATNTSHNRSRANSFVPENYQPAKSMLFIASAKNDPLSRSLAAAVFHQAKSSNYFSPILLNTLPTNDQYPALLVAVKEESFFWTPFYALSSLKTEFAFSNFSALSDIASEQTLVLPANGAGPDIHSSGDAMQQDRSFGIISLPGYRNLVIQMAAKTLLADLELEVQLK